MIALRAGGDAPLRADRPAPLAIVMLPGAYSVPEDFVR